MPFQTETSHFDKIDLIIDQILNLAGISTPPVDVLKLADLLGIAVLVDNNLIGRGCQKEISGRPAILIRPDDRPERIQWTVAHEVGEIIAHRIYDEQTELFDFSTGRTREMIANLVASRLLVPEKWFSYDAPEVEYDLFELKKRYQTASHEIIANRFSDLNPMIVITVFDQGKLTRRCSSCLNQFPPLGQIEKSAWLESHIKNVPIQRRVSGYKLSCWPVHEPGWKREILCTTFPESCFEANFGEFHSEESDDSDYSSF